MRVVLSIAGSDPTGGAGLQLDLQVLRTLGVHAAGVPTALTVQDSRRVHRVLPVFPSVVLEQIRALLADVRPDAVKIGMLASDDVARSVIRGLEALPEDVPVVLDPVLAASDGTPLLERRAWGRIGELARRAALLTPNRVEAERLTGEDTADDSGCERAAGALLEAGARAVLVKGGHREGAPRDLFARRDVAPGAGTLAWLEGERLPGGPVHGTGCALASAVAARLAHGDELADAVATARAFVREAIRRAHAVGGGARFLDPSAG